MRISKQLWFIFLFYFIGTVNPLFAISNTCSLNGQWFEFKSDGVVPIFLKQEGNKISLAQEFIHPVCGPLTIDGTSDGVNFSFKQSFTANVSDENYCQNWFSFSGTFNTLNCAVINGTATVHIHFTDDDLEASDTFKWYKSIIKIIAPSVDDELIISAEPRMPNFIAKVILEKPDDPNLLNLIKTDPTIPVFTWNVEIKHVLTPTKTLIDKLPEVTSTNPQYEANFGLLDGIRGGTLTLAVEYYQTMRDEKKYTIKGTNPGQAAVETMLTDFVSQHVACQESHYQQFVAKREGGVGFPNVGRDSKNQRTGGVGIMQLFFPKPTDTQVWNWRENIKEGLKRLADHRKEAERAHITERNRLNKDRKKLGLSLCPDGIPTPLTPDQAMREMIRRYNCGVEYRWEPRDAPDCAGHWVVYHSHECEIDNRGDPYYVDKVLKCSI